MDNILEHLPEILFALAVIAIIVFVVIAIVDQVYDTSKLVRNGKGWYGDCETQIWYPKNPELYEETPVIREMTESEYAKYCHDRR